MDLWIVGVLVVVAFLTAYRLYAGFLANRFGLDPSAETPAVTHRDGQDFVPTPRFALLAQHFSAISAAGPIVGPIKAGVTFGWGPGLAWIILGCIFIGAAHDFATLVASVRHGARSMAEILKKEAGVPAYILFLTFIWLALILVVINFTDVTAQAFLRGSLDVDGEQLVPGPGVASSSMLYLGLALALGLATTRLRVPFRIAGPIAVIALFGLIWIGKIWPLALPESLGAHKKSVWVAVILGYCFIASVTPLSLFLQPRGFLGGILLYVFLFIGVVGLFFGGEVAAAPAFVEPSTSTPSLFPFLFVTIACGACSGFHGLVCSGTTSKQLAKEPHARSVGYGAMLMEGLVATIALATVMMMPTTELAMTADGKTADPNMVFALGISRFGEVLGIPKALGVQFGLLALATFIYDTLDVCTRLGRYLLQELSESLFGFKIDRFTATFITCAVPGAILLSKVNYADAWQVFGASNQLLAGLSLLTIALWLRSSGKPAKFALFPMSFILIITLWALSADALNSNKPLLLRVLSTLLVGVGTAITVLALRRFGRPSLSG